MEYSAIKIKVNPKPPYSILNPDTNSDSPSEKSKGVRLVSATHERSQKKNKIGETKNTKPLLTKSLTSKTVKHFLIKRTDIRINDNLMSQEIVCAIPRRDPTIPYFLLEDQPDKNKG